MFLLIFKLYFILHLTAAQESEIMKAFKEHALIPDLIDEGPKESLKVSYDSGVSIEAGKELTPTQVQNPPKLEWPTEKGKFYTLIFTEPDAPSPHDFSLKEWIHWLIVNIPENDLTKGDVIYDYQGSGPDKESGFHRYVYLVFEQPKKLQFNEEYSASNSIVGRPKFSTMKFCEKYNLGSPIAGNFYLAQYDEYSNVIWKILGLNK